MALVTGAGSGIGAACAQRLAADGYLVVVADIDQASFVTGACYAVDGGLLAG